MMISKEDFVKLMNAIKEQREFDRDASEHLDAILIDCGGWYNNEALFSAIGVFLKNVMHDIGDWIGYFQFDLDWGEAWTDSSCSEADGTIIDISTIEKLYDFLVKWYDKE